MVTDYPKETLKSSRNLFIGLLIDRWDLKSTSPGRLGHMKYTVSPSIEKSFITSICVNSAPHFRYWLISLTSGKEGLGNHLLAQTAMVVL